MENIQKVCTKCKTLKSLTDFPARKIKKDGRASWCHNFYQENWKKRYYENHEHYRTNHNKSRNNLREQNARKVFEYLSENSCVNCGEADPIVLEFDHRDANQKLESISNLVFHSSWERIQQEIKKCDVLCANCHRRKSVKQFGYKRYNYVIM